MNAPLAIGYDDITWAPVCIGVTAAGLVWAWYVFRRRGLAAGMRGAAWALLPLGLYLVGVIQLMWRIGSQLGDWLTDLIFSPMVWAGGLVLILAVVLWVVSGTLLGHRAKREAEGKTGGVGDGGTPGERVATGDRQPEVEPRRDTPAKPATSDDLGDIEEILKRRGIS